MCLSGALFRHLLIKSKRMLPVLFLALYGLVRQDPRSTLAPFLHAAGLSHLLWAFEAGLASSGGVSGCLSPGLQPSLHRTPSSGLIRVWATQSSSTRGSPSNSDSASTSCWAVAGGADASSALQKFAFGRALRNCLPPCLAPSSLDHPDFQRSQGPHTLAFVSQGLDMGGARSLESFPWPGDGAGRGPSEE